MSLHARAGRKGQAQEEEEGAGATGAPGVFAGEKPLRGALGEQPPRSWLFPVAEIWGSNEDGGSWLFQFLRSHPLPDEVQVGSQAHSGPVAYPILKRLKINPFMSKNKN